MSLYSHWKKVHVWNLNPGDHIRVDRDLYYHHMLVVEVVDAARGEVVVIHYTTTSSSKKSLLSDSNTIVEEEVQLEEDIERVVYKSHVQVYSPRKALQRARSRLNEQEYSMYFNNCESFVNWALTSKDVTDQGTDAAVGTAAVGIGVAAAALYGLFTIFGGSDKDKKKDNEW